VCVCMCDPQVGPSEESTKSSSAFSCGSLSDCENALSKGVGIKSCARAL